MSKTATEHGHAEDGKLETREWDLTKGKILKRNNELFFHDVSHHPIIQHAKQVIEAFEKAFPPKQEE